MRKYDRTYLMLGPDNTPVEDPGPFTPNPELEVTLTPETMVFLAKDEDDEVVSVRPVPFGELLEAWERQNTRSGIIR